VLTRTTIHSRIGGINLLSNVVYNVGGEFLGGFPEFLSETDFDEEIANGYDRRCFDRNHHPDRYYRFVG
jgi:hypothetical protein